MPKRVLSGMVVSSKMDKTVVVRVERYVKHPLYAKFMKRSSKYMAHNPSADLKEGDHVKIIECKPYSKNKKWEVVL